MNTTQMEPETAVANDPKIEVVDGIEVTEEIVNDETGNEQEAAMATTAKTTKKTSKKVATKKTGAKATKPKATTKKATSTKAAPSKKTSTRAAAKPGDLTLGTLIDFYGDELGKLGKSPKTIASYQADLKIAKRYFGEDTAVASLTEKDVAKYFDSPAVVSNRKGQRRNEITIAKVRRTFRMALEHLAKIGAIKTAPVPAAKTE